MAIDVAVKPGRERTSRVSIEDIRQCGWGMLPPCHPVDLPQPSDEWTVAQAHADPPTVAVCIPFGFRNANGSLRWTPPEFTMALAGLQFPPGTSCAYLATKGVKRDDARNDLVHQALALRPRYILFLDDDNPPPPDTVLKLMHVLDSTGDEVALCAGIYTNKTVPASPLVFAGDGSGCHWKWKAGDVFECPGGIATGCMMIRASVFAQLPEPWFHDVMDLTDAHRYGFFLDVEKGLPAMVTDDLFFCKRVRDAGLTMLAHGGVLPGHWDQQGRCFRLADDAYPFRVEVGE